MKSTKYLLFSLALVGLYNTPAASQKLLETLNTYNTNYTQEKVHVHFDRSVYYPGETIWFKVYLLNGNSTLSNSTNFYAELLDEQGNVVDRKVYPMYESTAAGNFDLPKNLKRSNLTFRAYTTWMLNFDSSFLFTKSIPIFQSGQKSSNTVNKETQLRFFPEGGNWIVGLPAILAFKATDSYGFPKAVNGVIKNEAGKEITSFSTQHNGMGKISVDALPLANYYAEWKDQNNQVQKTPLPAQEKNGVALELTSTGSHIGFTLRRTENENLKKAYVVAQMYNQIAYRANVDFTDTETSGAIPVKKLISGILQFTVFDAGWKPVAERIVFINKNDFQFSANIIVATKDLQKRGKNTIEIEVPDTLKTNLSIAVTDASLKTSTAEEDIVSRFLLTSDLKGYIHEPAYYFSSLADSVKQHLDLVMLTNGWRRYDWEKLAQGRLPDIKYPRENYLTLQGNIYGITADQAANVKQLNLLMQTKDSSRQLLTLPVDKAGKFSANGLMFFDTVKVYYQLNKSGKSNSKATVNFNANTYSRDIKLGWNPVTNIAIIPFNQRSQFFSTKRDEVLPQYDNKVRTLQEVVVQAKVKSRQEEMERRYTSGLFQTGNARNFNIVDDPYSVSSLNVMNYLESRVAGLQIFTDGSSYSVSRRGETPALYVDEMQVDMQQLITVPMSEVAYIKVIDPPFIGAMGSGAGGAIAVYTRRGGEGSKASNSKGLEHGLLTGYNILKQFYSPDYATFIPLHEIEDIRTTLYWSPYVLTDKANKKIKIEFYNNDVSQSLRIVLEGLNENGQVTRVEKVIQ